MAMGEYSDYAKDADAPSNYSKAFENLNATVNHESYIGVHTIYAYEPSVCANWCNLNSYCKAFNIYVSRDPSRDPGPGCANPPATANFKVCNSYAARQSFTDGLLFHPSHPTQSVLTLTVSAVRAFR
jgi:hypothetical protein